MEMTIFQKLDYFKNDQNLSTTKNKLVLFVLETGLEEGMVTKIAIILINKHKICKIYYRTLLKTPSKFFKVRAMYLELSRENTKSSHPTLILNVS